MSSDGNGSLAPGQLPDGVTPDMVIDLTPPPDQLLPKAFRVGPRDEDLFVAAASVPVLLAAQAIRLLQGSDDDDDDPLAAAERTTKFLELVLFPEHRDRFHQRLLDLHHPIDHRLLFRTLQRLLEEWGLRPTGPSGDSSDGSSPPDAGTNSTAAPPSPAATSAASPSTGS